MTAARTQLAIADRLQWRYAPLDAEVTCTSAVLEAVRRQAAEARNRLAHGGLEIGGILLGRRTDRSMEIVGVLPIECEHKLGPLFILSTADEKALDSTLKSDKLGALQPVALYVSHSRSGFAVAETDAKLLDRLIPGPWQLVVIVMPAKFGPARAGFFIRGSIDRSFVCAHELSLAPTEHRLEPAARPAPIQPPALPIVEAKAGNGHATALERLHLFLAQVRKHWKLSQWNMATTLTLLLLFLSAGALWVRARGTPAVLPLHISDLGANLRIEWDPAQKVVRAASRATLEIRDGQGGSTAIPITRNGLDSGGIVYAPHSDNIEARLRLMRGNALLSESVLYFINPQRQATTAPIQATTNPIQATTSPTQATTAPIAMVSAKVAPAPAPPAAVPPAVGQPTILKPATVPPAILQPAATVQASQPVPELQPEQPLRRVVEKRQAAVEKTVKIFQLPAAQPLNTTAHIAPLNLPDLPDINTPASSLPLANESPLASLLTAPAHLAGPPQLRSGRLIWTGSLHKNAVLSITPSGPSFGVLSGSLPGAPVKVSIQPAELVDGGIAVYSKDPERSGTQAPSAWNGWKVVVYDWDPKRIAEVSLIEPPAPANNWKRLVLRNGTRNVSVFVVNWQRF